MFRVVFGSEDGTECQSQLSYLGKNISEFVLEHIELCDSFLYPVEPWKGRRCCLFDLGSFPRGQDAGVAAVLLSKFLFTSFVQLYFKIPSVLHFP